MARSPQRSDRWSLRQVSIEAGVSLATARAVVRAGHLDPARLTAKDVLVLKVAAMLPALQPLGELRPANAAREVPARDLEAVALLREAQQPLPPVATLFITADGAELATSVDGVQLATMAAAHQAQPYLALPVGKWAQQITAMVGQEAA